MATYDALLVPVTLDAAYKHLNSKYEGGLLTNHMDNVEIDGKDFMSLTVDISYPSLFNLTGHPVVVIPIGFTESGLPVGIQIIGKRWRDAELLVVANQLFKVGGDFRNPPDFKIDNL